MLLVLVSGLCLECQNSLASLLNRVLLRSSGEKHRLSETRTRTGTGSAAGVILPAHDFVCQQNPAHLWVLVLTLVDDGLKKTHLQVRKVQRTHWLHNVWVRF